MIAASDVPAIQPTGDTLSQELPADFSTTAASFRTSLAICGAAFLRSLRTHLTDDDVASLVPLVLHVVGNGSGSTGATAVQLRAIVRHLLRVGLTDSPGQLVDRAPSSWLAWQLTVLNVLIHTLRHAVGGHSGDKGSSGMGDGDGDALGNGADNDDDDSVISEPAPSPFDDSGKGTIKDPRSAQLGGSTSKVGATAGASVTGGAGVSSSPGLPKSATDVRSTGSNQGVEGSGTQPLSFCALICLLDEIGCVRCTLQCVDVVAAAFCCLSLPCSTVCRCSFVLHHVVT